MIRLINLADNQELEFRDYRELYLSICHSENLKLFEDHPEFGSSFWSFTLQSPERIAILYNDLRKNYSISVMKEAFTRQVGLLEICKGDFQKLIQIPLTPDVDVEGLKKRWCLDYCAAHGFQVIEVPPHPMGTEGEGA